MSFWESASTRHRFAREGSTWVNSHTEPLDSMVKGYAGAYHIKGWSDWDDGGRQRTLENTYHDFISFVGPYMAAADPRFTIQTRRGEKSKLDAKSLELALNQVLQDVKVRRFAKRHIIPDMMFKFAVTLSTRMPTPAHNAMEAGMLIDEPQMSPALTRVSPSDYIEDPTARSREQVQFNGWHSVENKWDLLERAESDSTWDKGELESMSVGDPYTADDSSYDQNRSRPQLPEMQEVKVIYIFVPASSEGVTVDGQPHPGPEMGYNGTLYTMDWDRATDIRKPIAWFGSRHGPLTVFGSVFIPEDALPEGPLSITEEQTRNLNEQADAIARASRAYKRLFITDSRQNRLAETIKNGPHDYVFSIRNFDAKRAASMEFGGIAPQQLEAYYHAKQQLDRNLSFHDTQRGVAPGSGTTATAVNQAGQSSDTRMRGIQDEFHEGINQLAENVLHWLFYDTSMAVAVSPETIQRHAKEIEMLPVQLETGEYVLDEEGRPMMAPPGDHVLFRGGQAGDGTTIQDLDLHLDASSMSLVEKGLEQAQQLEGLREAWGTAMALSEQAQQPIPTFYDVRKHMEMLAELHNNAALAELLDADALASRPPTAAADPKRLSAKPGGQSDSSGGGSGSRQGRTPFSQRSSGPRPSYGKQGGSLGANSGNLTGAQAGKVMTVG